MNLFDEYEPFGLQIVGFPCSQFLNQEPGSPAEIKRFARENMAVRFPLSEKINVNGEDAHPVFRRLRKITPCFQNPETGKIRNIPWNFAKFIIDPEGEVVFYSNPRQSLYRNIDEIEVILGLKMDSDRGESKEMILSQSSARSASSWI